MLERFYLMIYESLQIITTSIKKKKKLFPNVGMSSFQNDNNEVQKFLLK